jgi:hypothetical protein
MTVPSQIEQVRKARRAAMVRSLIALFLVICGTATATVGAGVAWGLALALVVLGGSLFMLGVLIAVVG